MVRMFRSMVEHPAGYTKLTCTGGPCGSAVVDENMLDRFSAELLRRCTPAEVAQLRSWVLSGAGLRTASKCSGTDAPIMGMEAVCRQISTLVGASFRSAHQYSCEYNAEKRGFLMRMFPTTPMVFGDVRAMSERGFDFKTQAWQDIPQAELLYAGFPCTDVSSLNPHAAKHGEVVKQAARSTGSVFHSVLRQAEDDPDLRVLVLENVMGLAAGGGPLSNLQECLRLLRRKFVTRVFQLNPKEHFGWPVSRPRLWFVCLKRCFVEGSGLSCAQAYNTMGEIMLRFVGGASRSSCQVALKVR